MVFCGYKVYTHGKGVLSKDIDSRAHKKGTNDNSEGNAPFKHSFHYDPTTNEHLILRRSIDIMIGVRGAQLTQATLLPLHAHVLGLLPWIPNYIQGAWT